jgi:hypothetical protein
MQSAICRLTVVTAVAMLFTAAAWSQPRRGLTWELLSTNPKTRTVDVGCRDSCDAYGGDTPCTTALPILCIKKTGKGFPLLVPTGVDNSNQYHRWAGGVVQTTRPVAPPGLLAVADAFCAKEFGVGWRVAEFHDGWGWHFQAAKGGSDLAPRFWVHINDQPGATCWK